MYGDFGNISTRRMPVPLPEVYRIPPAFLNIFSPAAAMLLKSVNVDVFADLWIISPCPDRDGDHPLQETSCPFLGRFSGSLLSGSYHARWPLLLSLLKEYPGHPPLPVGMRPIPSVAVFLSASGLQQGAVHSLTLGINAHILSILCEKYKKILCHDTGFVPPLRYSRGEAPK